VDRGGRKRTDGDDPAQRSALGHRRNNTGQTKKFGEDPAMRRVYFILLGPPRRRARFHQVTRVYVSPPLTVDPTMLSAARSPAVSFSSGLDTQVCLVNSGKEIRGNSPH
jgi:hypothetical protein